MVKAILLKRRVFFALPVIALGGFVINQYLSGKQAITKTIDLRVLQTFRDFFVNNELDPFDALHDYKDEPHDGDWPGFFFGSSSIGSDLKSDYNIWLNNSSPIQLPRALQFVVNIQSGYVSGYTIDLPVNLLSLENANLIASKIEKKLRGAAYSKTFSTNKVLLQQDANIFGFYKSIWRYPIKGKIFDSFFTLTIAIEREDELTHDADTLITGRDKNIAANKLAGYFIRLNCILDSDVMDELIKLQDDRRVAITGDRMKPLLLQDWYDSPNWRPADWNGNFV